MPPSMLSSEALVIWMFRIAMNAPIMAARIEIQTVALARSAWTGATGVPGADAGLLSARADMALPLRLDLRQADLFGRALRDHCRLRLNAGNDRHARAKLDVGAVEHDLHRD